MMGVFRRMRGWVAGWFGRPISTPRVVLAPSVAESEPFIATNPDAEPRYRVQRLDPDDVLHEAYAGDDGEEAVESWEAYRGSVLYGAFSFLDAHTPGGHRGAFARIPRHNPAAETPE